MWCVVFGGYIKLLGWIDHYAWIINQGIFDYLPWRLFGMEKYSKWDINWKEGLIGKERCDGWITMIKREWCKEQRKNDD